MLYKLCYNVPLGYINEIESDKDVLMLDCIAIVSGGLDSVTLLHYIVKVLDRRPAVLSFVYGQKHDREIEYARVQAANLGCREHTVMDLLPLSGLFKGSALVSKDVQIPTIEEVRNDPQPVTYVPNRNMIFLALAAAFAESHNMSEVYYGAQLHDMYGYWDTTPEFLMRVNEVYRLNRKIPIEIHAPFVNHSKTDIIRLGLKLGVDYALTWSCYEGREQACGKCPTCTERLQAFEDLGIEDPIPYATKSQVQDR